MTDFGWSYPPGCSSVPADDDPTCDCDQHPETHIHCPECKEIIASDDPDAECECCTLSARIDPMENGNYIGDESDGIYVDWEVGITHTLFASVVDCNSSGFTDSFGGAEYVPNEEAARVAVGRLYAAADWCVEFGIDYDRDDLDRYLCDAATTFQTENLS